MYLFTQILRIQTVSPCTINSSGASYILFTLADTIGLVLIVDPIPYLLAPNILQIANILYVDYVVKCKDVVFIRKYTIPAFFSYTTWIAV